jgi:ABC-type antimicrobial peptide transport system permease subunit
MQAIDTLRRNLRYATRSLINAPGFTLALATSVGSPSRAMALTVKTAGDPLALASALRDTVRELDRNLPISDIETMEEITASALARPRFATFLLGGFALLALTLAAIGTHETVSLLVSQRSREIGIRLALGAEKRTILASVLREGLALAAGGIAVGLAGARSPPACSRHFSMACRRSIR